jgi:26S proteasome regulatory subunit N7
MVRDLKGAATLLIDSITTFNSPEIISYNELVFYTVLTSMVSLNRADIKKKVKIIINIEIIFNQ